jgi:hypothetical protein
MVISSVVNIARRFHIWTDKVNGHYNGAGVDRGMINIIA